MRRSSDCIDASTMLLLLLQFIFVLVLIRRIPYTHRHNLSMIFFYYYLTVWHHTLTLNQHLNGDQNTIIIDRF